MKKAESVAADVLSLGRAWETAKRLFDYGGADDALDKALPSAGIRQAAIIFIAAGLLSMVLSLAIYVESLHFAAFTLKALSEVGALAAGNIEPDYSTLRPFTLFMLFTLPFAFLLSLAQEGMAYYGLRLTGGRGRFAEQYYLSSFVALGMAMSSGIMVLGPVPCVGMLAFAAYLLMTLYFIFIVRSRAYARLHGVAHLHAALVVLASCIAVILVGSAVNAAVTGALGLPQAAMYNISSMANVSGA